MSSSIYHENVITTFPSRAQTSVVLPLTCALCIGELLGTALHHIEELIPALATAQYAIRPSALVGRA